LGVAVSGGPDSLALLLLARAAYPSAVEAATVDHGLRPEAADEAAMVHALCGRLEVPHAVLARPDWFERAPSNHDRARALRYALLDQWSGGDALGDLPPWRAEWVATAHHQDDVAESLLLRARRGAGVGGLAAMPRLGPIPGRRASARRLVRPLLDWTRAELAAIVVAAGIEAVDDPSNRNPRYDRPRIRALLASTGELPPTRLARAAHNLRDAEDALAWVAEREWTARSEVADDGIVWLDPADLPHELLRRLVLRALDHVRSEFDLAGAIREESIERLIAALVAGRAATLAGVRAAVKAGRWRFALAPARRSH
jgi:tRNA(Ile)-lysidine synthase